MPTNVGRTLPPAIEYRPHRTLTFYDPTVQGTTYTAGSALTTGHSYQAIVPIPNCAGFCVRIKSAATGTLTVSFLRPNVLFDLASLGTSQGSTGTNPPTFTAYTYSNPLGSPVSVVANTETGLTVIAGGFGGYNGEAYCLVQFAATSTAALTYCDFSQIQHAIG